MINVINEFVDKIENKIIGYRRDFHKYPEAGWTEFRTASIIARKLYELGYDIRLGKEVIKDDVRLGLPSKSSLNNHYERAIKQGADKEFVKHFKGGYTGVVGVLKNGEGPTIGLRFDIDAVQVKESEGKEHFPYREGFSSVNEEVMHSCGHDGHIAIGLGVAEALMKFNDKFRGTVKLIFQPAEEGVRGAKAMVESGVVDDVDFLFGIHIGLKAKKSGELVPGTKGFLATSKFDAYFTGKPSHAGAEPEAGKNALLAASSAVLNLYSISRHSKGATRINVGKFVAGTGRNVIPSNAHLVIETRGDTSELNDYMKERAYKILKSSADMYDVSLRIEGMGEAESGTSDKELIKLIRRNALKLNSFNNVYKKEKDLGGSEDFTYMMKRVKEKGGKSAFIMLGSDLKGSHHSAEFDFNESDLKNGVKLLVLSIIDISNK
ncbi:amidohydrolase [Thermohalobacter berrensis]|uniref:Peptidase M20 n=1 Tax=Thermohalobacter berrensis TaxID=99594 RepID=A0A419SZ56_9FIRM|nr:amidohydrolase [Thermohalobacter berrensis]RKD30540.1 peptidase M20 [Thermohalobacter berrensis]